MMISLTTRNDRTILVNVAQVVAVRERQHSNESWVGSIVRMRDGQDYEVTEAIEVVEGLLDGGS